MQTIKNLVIVYIQSYKQDFYAIFGGLKISNLKYVRI